MPNLYLTLASGLGLGLVVAASVVAKKLGSLRDPLQIWDGLNNVGLLPIRLRAWIFSTIVGFANPYSRSINYRITELRKGKSCGVMKVISILLLLRPSLVSCTVQHAIADRVA